MEPLRIDHVGIAVNSLDEMRPFYEALGLKSNGIAEGARGVLSLRRQRDRAA